MVPGLVGVNVEAHLHQPDPVPDAGPIRLLVINLNAICCLWVPSNMGRAIPFSSVHIKQSIKIKEKI